MEKGKYITVNELYFVDRISSNKWYVLFKKIIIEKKWISGTTLQIFSFF